MSESNPSLVVRRAGDDDWGAIWPIFAAIVSRGDTYAYPPDIAEPDARRLWLGPGVATYVAESGGATVGTYVLKANQPGLGDHVANAGYMVAAGARGRGVGAAMCEHSLAEARAAGYRAMQFNFVVSTNERAVALWRRMGFEVVGTVPRAFRHRELGEVDVYVMHRFL
jgi:ribosomal protein S18 acetylase RimI-like enzyme